jgi:hypothetical protein
MAQFPIYRQQTIAQAPRASAAEFGGQVGQAMTQVGNTLTEIGVNMKRREDTIDRTMKARDFDAFAQEASRGMEPQDFARQETYDTYVQGLRAKSDELLASHKGTSASRAEFKNQLMNQIYQYEKGARETQVKAQQTIIGNVIEERTNQLSVDAGFAPDQLEFAFEELDVQIDQFRDAMNPAVLEKYKNAGRSAIAAASIEQLIARGQVDAAETVLKNPNVNKFLNPDATRRFTINIGAEKGKREAENLKRESNVQAWSSITGIPVGNMTPQQLMIAGNASTATMQMAEKLVLTEMLQGAPATPQQRATILGLDKTGRQTETQSLIADLPAFESGRMSPDEQSAFMIQAERLFPTQYRLDETSGTQQPIPGSGGIARLNQVLGRRVVMPSSSQRTPTPTPGSTPVGAGQNMGQYIDNSFVDAQGRTDFRALPPDPVEPSLMRDDGGTPDEEQAFKSINQGGGLFNMAERIAGPVAGVRRAVGGGPLDIGMGQQEVAAARNAELIQRRLVTALQQNPRYAEGEREDIAKSVSIEPAVMSNPTAYRTRLIEIGKYFQDEIKYNVSVLAKPASETTVQMRQQATQAISVMQKVYQSLGLPPTVKTPEEALKMQPRPRQILTPDGRLFDVPQE